MYTGVPAYGEPDAPDGSDEDVYLMHPGRNALNRNVEVQVSILISMNNTVLAHV